MRSSRSAAPQSGWRALGRSLLAASAAHAILAGGARDITAFVRSFITASVLFICFLLTFFFIRENFPAGERSASFGKTS